MVSFGGPRWQTPCPCALMHVYPQDKVVQVIIDTSLNICIMLKRAEKHKRDLLAVHSPCLGLYALSLTMTIHSLTLSPPVQQLEVMWGNMGYGRESLIMSLAVLYLDLTQNRQ